MLHNAIIDVRQRCRLCRHEMILLDILKTIRVRNFTIYHNVALNSLYINNKYLLILVGKN